jgi:DNA-binding CsgD family transcriptional regulator
MPAASETADRRLHALIRQSPFRLFLVRLSDSVLLEASRALEIWADRDRAELVGMRTLDYVTDPEAAERSMSLLATGVIDSYTRKSMYKRPDGTVDTFEVRFTAYANESPRRTAVAMVLAGTPPDNLEQPAAAGDLTVLGTSDSHWKIDRITSDVTQLLASPAEDLLGRFMFDVVHPEDVASLLLLAAHAGERSGTCGRLRLRTGSGDWLLCRVVLQLLAGGGPPAFAFALSALTPTPAAPDQTRARELEEHLRRIAREVAASGVAAWSTTMPTSIEMPEISRLTTREYEIVVRLSSGERVPAIARALFLSESTVRNHLTSVYRKFGVHSQHDLIARLHSVG